MAALVAGGQDEATTDATTYGASLVPCSKSGRVLDMERLYRQAGLWADQGSEEDIIRSSGCVRACARANPEASTGGSSVSQPRVCKPCSYGTRDDTAEHSEGNQPDSAKRTEDALPEGASLRPIQHLSGERAANLPDMPTSPCSQNADEAKGGQIDATPTPTIAPPTPEPVPVVPVLPLPTVEPVEAAPHGGAGTLTVSLTFYVCTNAPPGQSYCGTMSSGATVYEGAAACGDAIPLGTRFSIVGEGRIYVCEDRGAGPYFWIDIFHYDYYAGQAWRSQWPQSVEIELQS